MCHFVCVSLVRLGHMAMAVTTQGNGVMAVPAEHSIIGDTWRVRATYSSAGACERMLGEALETFLGGLQV